MPVVNTQKLTPNTNDQQVYNGLDCCVTFEVFEALRSIAPNDTTTYDFERALQAPALEMMLRGFRIDETERQASISHLNSVLGDLDTTLDQFARAIWDKSLNPRSNQQLRAFFYGAMKLPEIWTSFKGVRKLSMNRETLEKLLVYFHTQPIINTIMAIRDHTKLLSVLQTEIDPDGRMRTSYNIGATETWRWSSSSSVEGTGTNLQNMPVDPADPEHSHRRSIKKMFIADEGMELCGIDLEQAESRELGWQLGILFDDWTYLDAIESGDLHTYTAQLIWPNLPWHSGDKRKIADTKFYRDFSYRDISKRGGHGSSYLGTPFTMARHLRVPIKLMEDFQKAFFMAFPGITKYHRWVAQQLQTEQKLTNPFGMTRHFFGRPNDDATLREAIAFTPQSSTAVRLNLGLWRIWDWLRQAKAGYLTAQVHDAVYFQYPIGQRDIVVPKALELIKVEFEHKGRKFTVPGEAKVGFNWGNYHSRLNPNGLKKWKPGTVDNRICKTGLERVL